MGYFCLIFMDFSFLFGRLFSPRKPERRTPARLPGLPTKAALHETRKAAPGGRVPWLFVHRKILI
jgi:hypothetical protein